MIQTTVNPALNSSADNDPGYGQLLAVLVRRFPWFLGVFLASLRSQVLLPKEQHRLTKARCNFS